MSLFEHSLTGNRYKINVIWCEAKHRIKVINLFLNILEQDIDPCSNFTIIDYDESRHADNVTDYMYMYSCDWLNDGWYKFEGDYKPQNKPLGPNHCGYYNPIWMKGN